MHDIENKEDIKTLIDDFYGRAKNDALLGPIFENAHVDWEAHLPRMYSFWATLLIGEMSYRGSPYSVHEKLPVSKPHFDQWVTLFLEAVDAHFEGEVANSAKNFARTNAHIFESKMRMR